MRILKSLLFAVMLVLVGGFVFAQSESGGAAAVGTPPDWSGLAIVLINTLVPVAVYFVVLGVKKVIPLMPSWLIPLLAMALGAGVSWLLSYLAGGSVSPLVGALLGGLATVFNEIIKALNEKGITGSSSVTKGLYFK